MFDTFQFKMAVQSPGRSLGVNARRSLVCIVFFSLCQLIFSGDLFAQTNRATSATAQKNLLVLGDSLAAGYGLEPEQAFPAQLQQEIQKAGLNFKVVNAGVSGDTSAGGLRRIEWLLRQKTDVLLLELGGNDGLRGIQPEATKTNLQGIIDRAKKKYPEMQIVIAGMKMPPNMGPEYGKRFENIFPQLATENKALLVPFLLEGVGGRPELNLPDRIHPTAEGQKIVATNVWNVIQPLLQKIQNGSLPAK